MNNTIVFALSFVIGTVAAVWCWCFMRGGLEGHGGSLSARGVVFCLACVSLVVSMCALAMEAVRDPS